jgi:AraC-like DNA-binding protein
MLKETDLTVTEIAGRCGYTDSGYFSKLFQREYGSTPKAYRK